LAGCAGCTGYLKELATLLPLTIEADEPSQTFWHDYSRELRHKIDAVSGKPSWTQRLRGFFQPLPISAFAGPAGVAEAVGWPAAGNLLASSQPSGSAGGVLERIWRLKIRSGASR